MTAPTAPASAPATDRTVPPAKDFLELDLLLSEEERLLRDTVRQYVRDNVLPGIAEWYDQGVFPREMATEMGRLGLLGMHLDGYGCAGASATQYGLACME